VPVGGNLSFVTLTAGGDHTCGLTAAGSAYCWGYNPNGELGDGQPVGSTQSRPSPVAVTGGLLFAKISAGGNYTRGLTSAGQAYCWGGWGNGELGDGGPSDRRRSSPGPVAGTIVFAQLSTGYRHACGLTTGGQAFCWGKNQSGQLGDGTLTVRSAPVPVIGGTLFQQVAAGGDHSCGLTSAGAAACWGSDAYGQLGDGTTTNRATPGVVLSGIPITALSGFGQSIFGLAGDGRGYAWGWNLDGQLGDGTTTDRSTPVVGGGGLSFAEIAAASYHSCGRTSAGAVFCWGRASSLGNGSTTSSSVPVRVSLSWLSLAGTSFLAATAVHCAPGPSCPRYH